MTSVATLWVIYIVVVIVVFLILIIPQLFGLNFGIALFLALLIGAIVVFALSWTVNTGTLSTSNKTWFNVLLFVAYALPLLVALIVLIVLGVTMRKAKACKPKCEEKCPEKKPKCEEKKPKCPPKDCDDKQRWKMEHKAEYMAWKEAKKKMAECGEGMQGMHGMHGMYPHMHPPGPGMPPPPSPKVSKVLACDKNTGQCDLVAETVKIGDKKVTALFA